MDENLRALLILNRVKGFGCRMFKEALERCGSPSEVLRECFRGRFAEKIRILLDDYTPEEEYERCLGMGIGILGISGEAYPRSLREIHDPPMVLYVRGDILKEDFYAVAVVGTRKPNDYGYQTARQFSGILAERGLTVVSGLARGVDSVAHRGAMEAGGRTIAVLGCGLDQIYPPENESLYREIEKHGALISEYAPGTLPLAGNFPQRNRLISGLSLGVLVVAAHEKSGSLITARLTLEQGREVFAVPGRIDSLSSRGTNRLIKSGAALVESPDDIFAALAPVLKGYLAEEKTVSERNAGSEDDDIRSYLEIAPLSPDEICQRTGRSSGQIMAELTRMELQGLARKLPDGRFAVTTEETVSEDD